MAGIPLKHVRYPWTSKEAQVTVCIAAACDNGKTIVSVTDGLLSTEEASGEVLAAKMLWYGPWQFMYAGTPANFSLIEEEIEYAALADAEAVSRRNILETVRRAYRKVSSRYSSFDALNPFDMTMDELKKNGIRMFGEAFHAEMLREIRHRGSLFNEQIIVTGWGSSAHSAMIYQVGPSGDALHGAAGFTAIGSGASMAQTTLLLMDQGRHLTMGQTIFNVACSKFAAEKSSGVGKATAMYVSKKNTDDDSRCLGQWISDKDVDKLRALWETHLRPRVPDEAHGTIVEIAAKLNDGRKWRTNRMRDWTRPKNGNSYTDSELDADHELKFAVLESRRRAWLRFNDSSGKELDVPAVRTTSGSDGDDALGVKC